MTTFAEDYDAIQEGLIHTPGLFKKFAEVQAAIHGMRPDATVDAGKYSFTYISESALLSQIRPLLAERNVAVFVSVVSQSTTKHNVTRSGRGDNSYVVDVWASEVTVRVTFADGDTGQTFVVLGQGRAEDSGDKSVYKAVTSACRYVWWKTFLVPTDDDDVNQVDDMSKVIDLKIPLEGLQALVDVIAILERESPRESGANWLEILKRAAWRDYKKPVSELNDAESKELHEKMSQQLPEFQGKGDSA